MGAFTKRWLINKRRTRHEKITKLRRRYAAARSDAERNAFVAKARQVSPQMTVEEFLAPMRQAAAAK